MALTDLYLLVTVVAVMRKLACVLVVLAGGCGKDGHSAAYWADRLQDTDPAVRLRAVQMLSRDDWNPSEVVPQLVAALGDENEEVALPAMAALRRIGTPAIDSLLEALKDKQAIVRERAVITLGGMSRLSDAAMKALLKSLQDPEVMVRVRAAEAMETSTSLSAVALPALRGALTDDSAVIRYHACAALGKLGPAAREALPDLRQALQDMDADVRRAAQDALQKIE